MATKQIPGSLYAPDGSTYVTITDGAGNLGESGVPIGAVSQSGTWTVQPGNTANTTAWKVDASSVAVPVTDNSGSLTVDYATTGSGTATGALRVELPTNGTGVLATLGTITNVVHVDDNSGSLTVDYATTGSGTATGALRVELPTNGTGVVGLNAGSNLIGRAAADASAATGGIPSTSRLLSAAGTSGDTTLVKNAAGRVYAIQGANVATSARYLKLYNASSAPTAGAGTPVKTLYLPPSSAFAFDWPLGLTFATGIGFTIVTGSADNSSTSVTAGDILALNVDYA